MPLTYKNLIAPLGPITPEWFPGMKPEDVQTQVAAYLAAAYGRTNDDAPARAWAMALACRAVESRLALTPASMTLEGEGSQSITGEQIRVWTKKATAFEAEFDQLTATDATPDDDPSGFVGTTVVW